MEDQNKHELLPVELMVLQVSVLLVALCGIVYELIIATVSSYLLGNSVYQFSITIGLFMFAMGIGSFMSKGVRSNLLRTFVVIELILALVGGACSTILFLVFPLREFYAPTMYALTLLIGTLVGLEIPILMRILSETGTGVRKSVVHVLSLDYLGALVGSVAFPLLLLPHLGLFQASFAIALINLGVAAINLVLFRRVLRPVPVYAAITVAIGAMLLAGVIWASAVTRFAEDRLFVDRVIFRQQTPYQRIIVTRNERLDEHRLYLDGHLQFSERDEHRYHEMLVHPAMAATADRRNVLILGGGDGLAVREVLKYDDVELIDLVDIDPAITQLCSTFPRFRRLNGGSLTDDRVRLHHEDAFTAVMDASRQYGVVIIDLPDPHNEALAKLYSVEFYRMLAALMEPGGTVLTQSTSPFLTRSVYWSIARTLREAGFNVTSLSINVPSFGPWGFHLASIAPLPDRIRLQVATRFLTEEVIESAGVFGKDVEPVEGQVNSIFEPVLYRLYRQDLLTGHGPDAGT